MVILVKNYEKNFAACSHIFPDLGMYSASRNHILQTTIFIQATIILRKRRFSYLRLVVVVLLAYAELSSLSAMLKILSWTRRCRSLSFLFFLDFVMGLACIPRLYFRCSAFFYSSNMRSPFSPMGYDLFLSAEQLLATSWFLRISFCPAE